MRLKVLRYHKQCKCDLYNESVKVTTKVLAKFMYSSFSYCMTIVAAKSLYRTSDGAVYLHQLLAVQVLLFSLYTRMYAFFAISLLIFSQIIQVRFLTEINISYLSPSLIVQRGLERGIEFLIT